MFLKSDFDAALRDAVLALPAVAEAYRAGDPRVLAQMDALTTMLAMISQQIDVAEVEPFLKARTGTVIADAALKGVLPLARPGRVQITVTNPGASPVTLASGRGVQDSKGLRYVVEASAVVPASGAATITAQQITSRDVLHTVSGGVPFYEVEVPPSPDDLFLCGVDVSDAAGAFAYAVDFCNVGPGDRVFHVETDEYRRVMLRFGAADASGFVIGHQPTNGDVLTIRVRECSGVIELDTGAGFSLEYVGNSAEAALKLTLASTLSKGSKPADVDTLRMLASYPALHDSNAVYLSNFDFLLRRHIAGIEFLSVWNEQAEEVARGPNLLNINKLFVSFVIPGQSAPVSEAAIRQIIGRADNSLRVAFVDPVFIGVPVTVNAQVSVVHDPGDVAAQIRTVLLSEYGRGSVNASRGLLSTFRLQQLNERLTGRVPALQDQLSDFTVTIGSTPAPLPEQFRYFSDGSITVNVTRASNATGLWSV